MSSRLSPILPSSYSQIFICLHSIIDFSQYGTWGSITTEWMKDEADLLWIIFDLISSKLLMDLTLIIRKLSFTRISGPHEPIIDLSENRLLQSPCWSSQSTLQLWPSRYLKGYLFIWLFSIRSKVFSWPSVPNRKTNWSQKELQVNEKSSGRLQEVFLFGIWKNKH